jgi:hypothetical protein
MKFQIRTLPNFSIGLTYHPKDGRPEITLLRCNGPHGEFNGTMGGSDPAHPHWSSHIHTASESALDAGLWAEKNAITTTAFASYHQALTYFLSAVNVVQSDIDRYFSSSGQGEMFQ